MRGAELRAAVYAGGLFQLAPSAETLALAEAGLALVRRHFADPAANFWASTLEARAALAGDGNITALVRSVLAAVGLDPREHAIDAPRLRAVAHLGHLVAEAAPAYFPHRDTWYGNPRAQLNCWLALHDAAPEQTFRLWPDAFGRPLPNDSRQFALEEWKYQQARAVYPRLEGDPPGEPRGFGVRQGELVIFSAAHLHATCKNESGAPRFSLDFRAVHLGDHERGQGAPDPDNEAGAGALAGYARG